jgi:trehalose 6-phosphate phosphatase
MADQPDAVTDATAPSTVRAAARTSESSVVHSSAQPGRGREDDESDATVPAPRANDDPTDDLTDDLSDTVAEPSGPSMAAAALSDRDIAVLAFEKSWWRRQGAGDQGALRAVRDQVLPDPQRAAGPPRSAGARPRHRQPAAPATRGPAARSVLDGPPLAGMTAREPGTLPTPRTDVGRAGLAALRTDPAGALLAVDFDGTLAPIVADPQRARPYPGVIDTLLRLAGRLGSVAVLTGRPAALAARLTGLADSTGDPAAGNPDNLVVLGQYGIERWDAASGALRTPAATRGVQTARLQLPAVLAAAGVADAWIEDKGAAIAVHTRRSADPTGSLERLRAPLAALAEATGLRLEPGRLVLELRPAGVDKGAALLEHAGRRAARSVAYIGDDLGDLPAFDAVGALRERGVPGLTVCSGSAEVGELAARADLVVDGPPAVAALLAALLAALDVPPGAS